LIARGIRLKTSFAADSDSLAKLTGRRIQIEAVLEAAAIGLGADLEWGEFFAVYERASSDASAWLHEAQQAAGRPQETGKWKAQYAVRAGVEETLARLGN
jgi:hypothetical protein